MNLSDDNGLNKVGDYQLIPKSQSERLRFLPKDLKLQSDEIEDQFFRVVVAKV